MIIKKPKSKYLSSKYLLTLAGIILLYKSLVHAFIFNRLVDEEHIFDISANNLRVEEERRLRVLASAAEAANDYMETENKLFNLMIELNGLLRTGTNYVAQEQAKSEIVRLLSKLSYLGERSPELMAKGPFLYMMDIMAKTEARIVNARSAYNVAVFEYNDYIYLFPFNIFAKGLGFHEKQFYKAEEGAEHVPVVD